MTPTLPFLTTRFGAALLLVGGLLAARPATAQWVSQNSGLPTNSGIITLSIVDANNVWATAQDFSSANPNGTNPGNTFIRTTNGGTTWTPGTVPIPAAQTLVSVSAASPTVAWAASDNLTAGAGRVYYTADGGATWTRQLTTGFTLASGGFVNGVLALSTTQAVAAGDPAPGNTFEIYYTSNAGTTWTLATTPTRVDATEGGLTTTVVTVPGGTSTTRSCWMGTSSGRVLHSADSGVTWTASDTGLGGAISSVSFCSPTNGIATNSDSPGTVAYTSNGGTTWTTRATTGPFYTASVAGVPGQANTFVSVGASTSASGSSYSTDGGLTWTAIDALPHYTVAFLNGTTGYSGGFAASTTVGGMYRGTLPAVALAATTAQLLAGVSVYPNPATDNFTVAVPAVAGATVVQATLFNALGQQVARQEAALPAAGAQLKFPAAGLAAGLYTLRVQAGETVANKQVSVR